MHDPLIYLLIGFAAQLVDSTLGMAFGTLSSSLLLAIGFPPQALSATVHVAEIFSGGASALSHYRLKNIDLALIKKLALPAVLGAVMGAGLVSFVSNAALKPFIAGYFVLIGMVVMIKVFAPNLIGLLKVKTRSLGFLGGFLDAFGGAGWGEVVSSGLVLKGRDVRTAVGSLNVVEFIITATISLVFLMTIGITHWQAALMVALGGMCAAPLGAYACKRVPAKPLMFGVGLVIVLVGLKTLLGF